ncbi:3D domain-containing protein [Fredinandcohnia onubensis]|uniref:3D domain-containing protein n=1 Tax=Fredinandcohnia onubensis TaxID=1571209 RepID=UPI000C0BD2A4|nr:3D domain-containing protein [Fredinandcohnia onubensis]
MLKKMVAILTGTVLSVTVSANVQASMITVQKGDTLWDLSRAQNTSVKNTKMLNNLSTDLIHPGDELFIAPEKQYTVKKGDTLWDIAIDHQVKVSQIKEWNQLHSDLIHPGLNLVLFEGARTVATAVADKPVQSVEETTKETTSIVTSDKDTNKSTPVSPAATTEKPKESAPVAPAPEKPKESSATKQAASTSSSTSQKEITVTATAYTATCEGCSGITSTGINLLENPDAKVISVDPSVIPLGSKVHVEGYGEAIAGDTGGAIKGNKIDIFIPSKQDAINYGVQQVKVTILD